MFKTAIVAALTLLLCSCGDLEKVQLTGLNGANGSDGVNGTDGRDGADGFNSLLRLSRLSAEQEVCQSGSGLLLAAGLDKDRDNFLDPEEIEESSVAVLCDGAPGPEGPQGAVGPAGSDGSNGSDGKDGTNGSSCTIEDTESGAIITCGDSSQTIYDGQDGLPGEDGQDGQDGQDGSNGSDGSSLTPVTVGTNCSLVVTGLYAKSSGSSAVDLYPTSSCVTNQKIVSLTPNADEVFFRSDLMIVIESSTKLYLITF